MSNAVAAIGTQLQIGNGATPETFTTIAEITNITGPGLSLDLVDVTNMDSPNHYKEVLPGFKTAGEVTFDINWIPADSTHDAVTGILARFEDRAIRNFKLIFPDSGSTTWSFTGFVTAFSPTMAFDDKLTASVTVTVSGAPTLA